MDIQSPEIAHSWPIWESFLDRIIRLELSLDELFIDDKSFYAPG